MSSNEYEFYVGEIKCPVCKLKNLSGLRKETDKETDNVLYRCGKCLRIFFPKLVDSKFILEDIDTKQQYDV